MGGGDGRNGGLAGVGVGGLGLFQLPAIGETKQIGCNQHFKGLRTATLLEVSCGLFVRGH